MLFTVLNYVETTTAFAEAVTHFLRLQGNSSPNEFFDYDLDSDYFI